MPAAPVEQLFLFHCNDFTTAMLAKIVDDVLLAGLFFSTNQLIDAMNLQFSLGTIVLGPGKIRCFDFNIT